MQPPPTQGTAPLDVGTLTNELMNQKHAIDQVHAWVTHIAECVTNHATMIDEANTEAGVVRGKLAAYERQLGEGFQGAEERLSGTFAKVDELIGQLRAETTTTATQLAEKCEKIESALSGMCGPAGPPGLPGEPQELRTLSENVRVLHDRMSAMGDDCLLYTSPSPRDRG